MSFFGDIGGFQQSFFTLGFLANAILLARYPAATVLEKGFKVFPESVNGESRSKIGAWIGQKRGRCRPVRAFTPLIFRRENFAILLPQDEETEGDPWAHLADWEWSWAQLGHSESDQAPQHSEDTDKSFVFRSLSCNAKEIKTQCVHRFGEYFRRRKKFWLRQQLTRDCCWWRGTTSILSQQSSGRRNVYSWSIQAGGTETSKRKAARWRRICGWD